MKIGSSARKRSDFGSILANHVIEKINQARKSPQEPQATAYIINSWKHPEESKLFRDIYGHGYYQIGVYTSEEQRVSYFKSEKNIKIDDAYKLILKDVGESEQHGQQTRDTFQLSDFFVTHNQNEKEATRLQLERVSDLIFGNPYITPTLDEHMMYLAYSYSTRSADLSRQVGAVISNQNGDVIGLGSNDVPRSGGGPYWPSQVGNTSIQDHRDYSRGEDSNQRQRNSIILNIMKAFDKSGSNGELIDKGKKILQNTGLLDITEFGRATHAEMSAILNCTRSGISPKGGTLYCTTFPCHNCAKHIIDSGISKVLFVEPYPKSLAEQLHNDAISFHPSEEINNKVTFSHFIGVGAKRYLDLFSLRLSNGNELVRKNKITGKIIPFNRGTAKIRYPLINATYTDKELRAVTLIPKKGT